MRFDESDGFTLIELLVVIAIIGVLATIILSSLMTAIAKGRDSKRLADLHTLQTALELYANDHNGRYPVSLQPSNGLSGPCPYYGGYALSGSNGYIPNLAPQYIPSLPVDPKLNSSTNPCYTYLYASNGTDYMILSWYTVETYTSANNPKPWPQNPTQADFDLYTPGAASW